MWGGFRTSEVVGVDVDPRVGKVYVWFGGHASLHAIDVDDAQKARQIAAGLNALADAKDGIVPIESLAPDAEPVEEAAHA